MKYKSKDQEEVMGVQKMVSKLKRREKRAGADLCQAQIKQG